MKNYSTASFDETQMRRERLFSSDGELCGSKKRSKPDDAILEKGCDPIMESYKSLVTVINKASSEFQEGKKWKCNEYCGRGGKPIKKPDTYPRSWKDFEQVMFAPPAKKNRDRRLTSRSRTTDESQSSMNRTGTQANKSRNQLVRQLATEDHGSRETLDGISEIASQKKLMSIQGKNPATGSSLETCPNPHRRTAFLLRPVSKNSSFDLSGLFPIDKPITPTRRAAIAAAVVAAGGPPVTAPKRDMLSTRTLSTGEMHQGPGCYSLHIRHLQKQLTSESAPTTGYANFSLQRQFSTNSAYTPGIYSTGRPGCQSSHYQGLYNYYSRQDITLIRGASCSLVDIPTGVGVGSRGIDHTQTSDVSPGFNGHISATLSPTVEPKPMPRPRMPHEMQYKKHSKASAKKTKWTILCIGLTLFTMSVSIVGTMLIVGSQYQQKVIAKQWETLIQNKTYGGTTTTTISPLIFLTDATKDEVLIEENSEHEDNWFDSINASSSKEEEENIDDISSTNQIIPDKAGHTDTARIKSNVKGYSKAKENLLNALNEEKVKGNPKTNIKMIIQEYIFQHKNNQKF